MSEHIEAHSEEKPFLAWKAMSWDNDKLLSSPQQRLDWIPRTAMRAYCGRAHDLRGDNRLNECSCGIYARKEIDKELLEYLPHGYPGVHSVLMQIAMWGSWLFEGHTGWRAEYAYPRTILVKSTFPEADIELMGEKYGVPVVVADEAFQTFTGRVTTMKFSAEQLEQARHQLLYRKWYNDTKLANKKLRDWERTVNETGPNMIKALKAKLERLSKSKPVRKSN